MKTKKNCVFFYKTTGLNIKTSALDNKRLYQLIYHMFGDKMHTKRKPRGPGASRLRFVPSLSLHRGKNSRVFSNNIILTTLSPIPGYLEEGDSSPPSAQPMFKFIDYEYFSLFIRYLTIAFVAASPSTATTTTPAGAAICTSSLDATVLATV